MLPADHPNAPKYWKHETGGELGPAVLQYLSGKSLTLRDVALMKAYLRQWVNSPAWGRSTLLDALRESVAQIRNRDDLERCISATVDLGMDPL